MAQKISEKRVNEGCWLAGGSEERFLHCASRLVRGRTTGKGVGLLRSE
jgi:hypothetical protein